MGRLDGKVAIITGAGSGLGRAMALLFAKEGAKTAIAELRCDAGTDTVRMIEDLGGKGLYIKTDVTESKDMYNMVRETADAYGRLDILVNSAGITEVEGGTVDCGEDIFDRIIMVNLKGVWLGMKYAIPEMLKSGGGSIINMCSHAAFRVYVGIPIYTASKGAVLTLSRSTAVEFASKNIRVNCIAPGPIETPISLELWGKESHVGFARLAPRGKLGTPEEIASVALFLASDESAPVTAQTIIADGGTEADMHVGIVNG